MSLVHENLARLDSDSRMPQFARVHHPKSEQAGIFAFDLPKEIINGFLDLSGHISIANAHSKVKVLSITSSVPGEGSSTIAMNLAFLMAGGLTRRIDLLSQREKAAASAPATLPTDQEDRLDSFFTRDFRSILHSDSFKSAVDIMQANATYGPKENTTMPHSDLGITENNKNEPQVLLVDANLRRPTLHNYFGLDRGPGLGEILEKDVSWQTVVHTVKDSELFVITAGDNRANPSELLANERMQNLISSLRKDFNYIIFDSPSVLPTVDAISLASVVDGVILIVRAGQTRWETAQNAKTKLLTAQANLLGVALNRQRSLIPDGLYKRSA